MAKYDVYQIDNGYLLDVQADILSDLNTRVMVPLMLPEKAPKPARRLNPVFEVEKQKLLMVTQYIATVPKNNLGKPKNNLSEHFAEITNAMDMFLQGY